MKAERVLRYLRNTLKQRDAVYVTTFFDLHGLPRDFPGVAAARRESDPLLRAGKVEEVLHHEVVALAGCRPSRFLPHIQPCEFEALLFSDLRQFETTKPSWAKDAEKLAAALRKVESPEHLNDGPETHPSFRLRALRPRYRKVFHGQLVADRIGLDRIRAKCAHFNDWLTRLEALEAR